MAISLADLEIRLSGGAANADQNLSLGGAMSSERVLSQSSGALTNVTGVTIDYAGGNDIGNGTLAFTATGTLATWAGFGSTSGNAVDIGTDGKYTLIGNGGEQVMITVVAASLPVADQTDNDIAIANISNETFDDIDKIESFSGDDEYRCFYVTNTHATESFLAAKLYISSQASGADSLEVALDTAGLNVAAATVADESTAPAGATFSAPTTGATGLDLGVLAPGDFRAFWQKRTVPAATTVETLNDISEIAIEATY